MGCGLTATIGRWFRQAGTLSAYLQAYCMRPWDENERLETWGEVVRGAWVRPIQSPHQLKMDGG